MPNNSNARQKKQNKKKKTVPPPLHKEDKANKADATSKDSASLDTSTLPLSLAGKDKASKDSSSLVGKGSAPDLSDPKYLELTLAARRRRIQDVKDSPLSLPSPAGSVSKEDKSMDASSSIPPIKDASLSLLNLGNLKAASPPSLRAQPKSDASPDLASRPHEALCTDNPYEGRKGTRVFSD